MNKLVGIFLLGAAVSLTACGGDSDSSGSSNNDSTLPEFANLPNCSIQGKNINVKESAFPSCLVKRSNINDGKTFSLRCQETTINTEFFIRTTTSADIKSIEKDIRTYFDSILNNVPSTSKYNYICNK